MIKILFICHGNICRSPMAEYILKDMVKRQGRETDFDIQSAATSREEIACDIYPPAKRILQAHGIEFSHHEARQVTEYSMENSDIVIIMDDNNARNLNRMFGDKYQSKVYKLMSFAGENRDVSDPWYTDDFETAFKDIEAGCMGLLERKRYSYK